MRHRAIVSALVLATAAACGTATEGPAAPPRLALEAAFDEGPPPPPPIDTGDVQLDGGSGSFSFENAAVRYFVNKSETVAWLQFSSNSFVTATPNARLLYNQKAGTTTGIGILTDGDGTQLDLSTVVINKATSDFDACDGTSTFVPGGIRIIDARSVVIDETAPRGPICGGANFTSNGTPGYLAVYSAFVAPR